jgi:hypothetical protein
MPQPQPVKLAPDAVIIVSPGEDHALYLDGEFVAVRNGNHICEVPDPKAITFAQLREQSEKESHS